MNFLVIFLIVKRLQSGMCVSVERQLLNSGQLLSLNKIVSNACSFSKQRRHQSKNYIGSLKSSNITSSSKKPLKTTDANATDVKVSDLKMNLMNPFFVCNAWHFFYPRLLLCR